MKPIKSILSFAKRHPFIAAFLTLILWGPLGTSFYQNIVTPVFEIIFNTALSISTLGVINFRDSLYLEAAKGLHESSTIEIFTWISSALFALVFWMLVFFLFLKRSFFKKSIQNSLTSMENQSLTKSGKYFRYFSLVFLFFILIIILTKNLQSVYINRLITYYNQVATIVRPYVLEREYLLLNSKFSLMSSKKDYEEILTTINQIATDNFVKLPVPPDLLR